MDINYIKFPDDISPTSIVNGSDRIIIAKASGETFTTSLSRLSKFLGDNGQQVEPVLPGELPYLDTFAEKFMQVTEEGDYYFEGELLANNPKGYITVFWWSNGVWELSSQYRVLGEKGDGVVSVVVNDDGDLIITYTDGSIVNAGRVKGSDGDPLPYSEWSIEDVNKLIEDVNINAQRIPAVAPGALPTPSQPNTYMVVTDVGAYTYGGVTIGTNADGYQTTFWWNGTAWSNNGSVYIKGDPIPAIDNLTSTSATDALSANMGRELDSKIRDVAEKLPNEIVPVAIEFPNTSKYLYAVDGRMINSSLETSKVSDFVDINYFGYFLNIDLKSQINANTACAVCYYSSNLESDWISSQFINNTVTTTIFQGELIIPTGATHIRFATYNSDAFELKKYVIGKAVDESRVDAIENELPNKVDESDFEDEVDRLESSIESITEKLPQAWQDTGLTLDVSGSVVNINGNQINSGAGRRTDFIAIDKTKSHRLVTRINTNTIVGVAYYETDDVNPSTQQPTTFISAQGTIPTTTPETVDVVLIVPSNANFYRFSGYDTSIFKLYESTVGDVASKQEVEVIADELEVVKEDISDLDPKKLIGSQVQAEEIRYRDARNINIGTPSANTNWYGVEFIEEDTNKNNITRIASNMNLHRVDTGLPIHKKIKRCVMNKNGTVNYYLSESNSAFKADGVTPSKLDGTDGDVMVEIPEHWRKVTAESTTFGGNPATKITVKISEYYQDDTWLFIQKSYTSAYEATMNWDTQKASSVCTTIFKSGTYTGWGNNSYDTATGGSATNSAQLLTKTALAVDGYTPNATTYRGGTNRASLDNFQSIDDIDMPPYDGIYDLPIADVSSAQQTAIVPFIKTGLGRNLSNTQSRGRIFWREKARANSARHNIYMYDNAVTLYWLATIEYATRDLQQPINNTPDSNGYRQGGLGIGASSMIFNDFEGFKGHPEDQAAVGILPCGITNGLGNASGEVHYYIPYFPYGTGSGQGGTWAIAGYKPYMVKVMSYRGVENFYGHLYKVMDGINVQMNQIWRKRNPANTAYESEYGASGNAKSDIQVYYTPHASAYGEWINEYYEKLSDVLTDDYCIFYIKNLAVGDRGHIIPSKTDGKSAKYYWDITEFYNYSEQMSLSGRICYMTIAGRLVNGNFCGPLFTFSAQSGNQTRPSDTIRLDYR